MDYNDFIVFGAAVSISFIFGALIQLYHHNFHIKQLKECLDEINRDIVSEQIIEQQKIKSRRITWIAILAIICGLLLLSYLIVM